MANKDGKLTPMMQQFYDLKMKHPEALLLFRCGDFYETYCDDAVEASKILGITLTRRNNGASQGDAMAGFPYHALDTYLPKLIRAGKRVAICDQLEDPKKTKTLVKRGITELVTPGVVQQDNVLSGKENNFLCSIYIGKGSIGVGLLDISTGEFLCGEGSYDYANKVIDTFQPKEVVYDRTKHTEFSQHFSSKLCTYEMEDWVFTLQAAEQRLHKHFGVRSLKGFGINHLKNGIVAAGAIIEYLILTEHKNIRHITSIRRLDTEKFVRMDNFTLRSLELLNPMTPDGVSLLSVIDRTATAMGGRMLRRWLTFPLKDVSQIRCRHDIVDYCFREPQFRELIDEQLHRIADLERIISKVSTRRVNPREMRSLMQALEAVGIMKYSCENAKNDQLNNIGNRMNPLKEMKDRIKLVVREDAPQLVAKGGYIGNGVNDELDKLREIRDNGKAYLIKMQDEEIKKTGISSLKIGYNNVFGYYLEVRNTFKDHVPETWIRKQTLAQAERYITPELKEYEETILSADEKILVLEDMIFNQLIDYCQENISQVQLDAMLVAELDCLLSMAITSEEHHYIRPIIDDSNILDIHGGRHPVIETQMPVGEFYVPNDVRIAAPQPPKRESLKNVSSSQTQSEKVSTETPLLRQAQHTASGAGGLPQIIIITGPNMAGKSALLRQTALIVILAQIGCFVPAESAKIGIVDRIFTRVGASDNIAAGESTFMVEMTEASNILNNVTEKSLVLFDELGRGTSTYDGISIAWAIVEYLHQNNGGRVLFATHYHELNEMAQHFPRIKNYNVSVKEVDGKVIFLRKLVEGGSEHSFGIHVAEIAGMPRQIIKRANMILKQLEEDNSGVGRDTARATLSNVTPTPSESEMSFFQLDDPVLTQIRDEILDLDVNNLTPLQALNKLNDIKKILRGA